MSYFDTNKNKKFPVYNISVDKSEGLLCRQGPVPVQPGRVPALRQPLLGLRVPVAAVRRAALAPPRAGAARGAPHAAAHQAAPRHRHALRQPRRRSLYHTTFLKIPPIIVFTSLSVCYNPLGFFQLLITLNIFIFLHLAGPLQSDYSACWKV